MGVVSTRRDVFVVVAPGLEAMAAAELHDVASGLRGVAGRGGVACSVTNRQLYAIHRWARIPTRVLVRVATAHVRHFDELVALVRTVDWARFRGTADPVDVHATAHGSRLFHTGAIAERVTSALGVTSTDHSRPSTRVHVRIQHDKATISIDATGAPLHHRGWSAGGHAAPLRPTLAAAMLRAIDDKPASTAIDPMTGAGTIAIEAASRWQRLPIDRPEGFAFQCWPEFEPGTWASVAATRVAGEARAPRVIAGDRDAGAIDAARRRADGAGVGQWIEFQHAALAAQTWPGTPGAVVCNPPYGHRLGDVARLRDLYAVLGRRVQDGGHRLCLLVADKSGAGQRLLRATGVELEQAFSTTNGGLSVGCWVSRSAGHSA